MLSPSPITELDSIYLQSCAVHFMYHFRSGSRHLCVDPTILQLLPIYRHLGSYSSRHRVHLLEHGVEADDLIPFCDRRRRKESYRDGPQADSGALLVVLSVIIVAVHPLAEDIRFIMAT